MKKKSVLYLSFVFIAIISTIYFYGYSNNDFLNFTRNFSNIFTNEKALEESSKDTNENTKIKQVAEKDKKFVCGDNISNSSLFINEIIIPFPCSQPVGLTTDKNNNIWIAADWSGYLLVFNPQTKTF